MVDILVTDWETAEPLAGATSCSKLEWKYFLELNKKSSWLEFELYPIFGHPLSSWNETELPGWKCT